MIKHLNYVRTRRLLNNRLVKAYETVEECVRMQLGIQAQYSNYALISILLRTGETVSITDIYSEKRLYRTWVQRDTVHLISEADFLSINKLRSVKKSWVYSYLSKHGISFEDVLDYLKQIVLPEGVDSKQISQQLKEEFGSKVNLWSCSLILGSINHIMYGRLVERGILLHKFPVFEEKPKTFNWQVLFERYLLTYGPATLRDFSHWIGVPSSYFKDHLKLDSGTIEEIVVLGEQYYQSIEERTVAELGNSYPLILSKFDPLMVAYKDKNWILNGIDSSLIWKAGGQIEAVIINREGIIGTWKMECRRTSIKIFITPFLEFDIHEKEILESKFKSICFRMNRKHIEIEYLNNLNESFISRPNKED